MGRKSVEERYLSNFQKQPPEVVCKKKMFLKMSQNLPENICVWQLYKRLQHRCFPVKFAKLLRAAILKNICERLLLNFKENFYVKLLNLIFITPSAKSVYFPVGWILFFSMPINHVINLLFNDVIYICFSVSFYSIAFITNRLKHGKSGLLIIALTDGIDLYFK